VKSSSFNNENGTSVYRESQLRALAATDSDRTSFIDKHRDRTQRLVDERLDYLHERWEVSHTLRGLIGLKKKVAFEEWLKNQYILQVWPDGTNLEERRPPKVFGLIAESLTYVVNNEFIVKLKPNSRVWLEIESIELKE
jgi:hypothetical protein